MESRLTQLQQRVTSLRAESEEVWKTLETAESTLLEMLSAKDYDCSGYFGENAMPASKPLEISVKLRADRQETEEFYLTVSTLFTSSYLNIFHFNFLIFPLSYLLLFSRLLMSLLIFIFLFSEI